MSLNSYKCMSAEFAPKTEETLKNEIIEELGIEYEGNEETVDKLVARGLKDEEFKASLHADKKKHLESKEAYKQRMLKAGLDPETGEKLRSNDAGTEDKTSKNDALPLKDIRALQDVPDEDVEDVMEWAKFKGISISEAKNTPHIKTLLKERAEERASAQVANTNTPKRNLRTNTDEQILNDFASGKIPESDEDMRKLVEAQLAQKRAHLKA